MTCHDYQPSADFMTTIKRVMVIQFINPLRQLFLARRRRRAKLGVMNGQRAYLLHDSSGSAFILKPFSECVENERLTSASVPEEIQHEKVANSAHKAGSRRNSRCPQCMLRVRGILQQKGAGLSITLSINFPRWVKDHCAGFFQESMPQCH